MPPDDVQEPVPGPPERTGAYQAESVPGGVGAVFTGAAAARCRLPPAIMKALCACRLLALSLLCWPMQIPAYQVEDLYTATVVVSDQGTAAYRRGLQRALEEVLIKLSADPDIIGQAAARSLLLQAESLMQSYHYRTVPPAPETESASAGPEAPGFLLEASFQESALTRALQSNGVPSWGRQRPLLLLWVVQADRNGNKVIRNAETDSPFLSELEQQLRRLGLPFLFPLLDLEDDRNLSAVELWAGIEDRVREASRRYHADAALTVRLPPAAASPREAVWSLYLREGRREWSSAGPALLRTGIQSLLSVLRQEYGRPGVAGEGTFVELNVTGITHFERYLRVLHHLLKLDAVHQVRVLEFHADRVRFRLLTHLGATAVHGEIGLGNVLRLATGPEAGWYLLLP